MVDRATFFALIWTKYKPLHVLKCDARRQYLFPREYLAMTFICESAEVLVLWILKSLWRFPKSYSSCLSSHERPLCTKNHSLTACFIYVPTFPSGLRTHPLVILLSCSRATFMASWCVSVYVQNYCPRTCLSVWEVFLELLCNLVVLLEAKKKNFLCITLALLAVWEGIQQSPRGTGSGLRAKSSLAFLLLPLMASRALNKL